MLVATDNLALVKGILDRMLASGDIQPLLDGLADDVMFTVPTPQGSPDPYQGTGKAAVLDYFVTLGDLVTFWRVQYSWGGARVLVRVEESFTIEPGGLAAHSEVALVFELRDGLITRLLVVEDPPVSGGTSVECRNAGAHGPFRERRRPSTPQSDSSRACAGLHLLGGRSARATDGPKPCRVSTLRETVLRGNALPSG
jgi:ketosteroid isomerase-like protein